MCVQTVSLWHLIFSLPNSDHWPALKKQNLSLPFLHGSWLISMNNPFIYKITGGNPSLSKTFSTLRALNQSSGFLQRISKQSILSPYWSALDLWRIEFEKSSWMNLTFLSTSNLNFAGYTVSKNQVRNRPKIKFVKLHISNSIFQKSSADQQGD